MNFKSNNESDFKFLNIERVKTMEEVITILKLFKVTFRLHKDDIPEQFKYLFNMKNDD